MIPSILSGQVRAAIEEYLRTRYRITTPHFREIIEQFIQRGEAFKGAYLSLNLPFKQQASDRIFFPEFPPKYTWYSHQERAFERLESSDPQPTIVATGTGSGKTEAFLYPILEHCRTNPRAGIKAILIYPMNALATDQARRIAHLVDESSLKGNVTAGLYIGGRESKSHSRMTAESVITKRETMWKHPPDILMTNYKMLDYMLVRPRDSGIWRANEPDGLKFLVIDELHTFDGAQGTDLACLIRRLKHRLQSPDVCPIGTSATLGSDASSGIGQDPKIELCEFASALFDRTFTPDAIITEERQTAADFTGDVVAKWSSVPPATLLNNPADFTDSDQYIAYEFSAWFDEPPPDHANDPGWRRALGGKLMQHVLLQNLVKIVGTRTIELRALAGMLFPPTTPQPERVLVSLLALVSHARHPQIKDAPLLGIRVQTWARELRRMVVSVSSSPRLVWNDDLADAKSSQYLPLVACDNCGAAGWLSRSDRPDEILTTEGRPIYTEFFAGGSGVRILYPEKDSLADGLVSKQLCTRCMKLHQPSVTQCLNCLQADAWLDVAVFVPKDTKDGKVRFRNRCVFCRQRGRIVILGAQNASLTSVGIGQLFGSQYNDDKKLLAFSDSVQDASHRAGYFQARTYTFTVRSALVQFIRRQNDDRDLKWLAKAFVEYELNKLDATRFVGTFIAPNLCWRSEYERFVEDKSAPVDSRLLKWVRKRLEWDALHNLGLHARRGRTLENTRSVAAAPRYELFDGELDSLVNRLSEEVGGLRTLTVNQIRRFITGLVYRLRTDGGIDHEALGEYIRKHGTNSYVISERHINYMPRYAKASRRPAFITSGKSQQFLPVGGTRRRTWIADWATKCLYSQTEWGGFDPAAVLPVLGQLTQARVLECHVFDHHQVWCLRPESVRLTTRVAGFECERCSYDVSVPEADAGFWHGMPCLRYRCTGTFTRSETQPKDYYRERYRASEVVRFVANEHTGLLLRKEREQVEKEFMAKERWPWYSNILSCTPTLELGINIGDLSSLILCNVPPAQANFVQRVGRAGRLSGNAYTLTLAGAKPHDLYFFADPRTMIEGRVEVPGTYLKAPAVLKRQLNAFSMDAWVAHGIGARSVPNQLRFVLTKIESDDSGAFPYNWLNFTEERAKSLLDQFLVLFGKEIDADCEAQLRKHLCPNPDNGSSQLRLHVLKALRQTKERREDLQGRRAKVQKEIKKLDESPKDKNYGETRRKLVATATALGSHIREIAATNVFNFLTDEGILPNYTFPQDSVELKTTILRTDAGEETRAQTHSFLRPGMVAIRELAPGSHFYAGGRNVEVHRIVKSESKFDRWRFCDQCAWTEIEPAEATKSCPRCQSTGWRDRDRVRQVVRMSHVEGLAYDRDSRNSDDREERQREAFHVRTHIQIGEEQAAYRAANERVPFGLAYVPKTTFRMINFGRKRSGGPLLQIAGDEFRTTGFETCPKCYCVKTERGLRHEWGCPRKDVAPDSLTELYLYHEFESESIRILLPVVASDEGTRIRDSFRAALELGLKIYYRGQVDHLRTTTQDHPIGDGSLRQEYVYLFDTVPGGTGYLKNLVESPDAFWAVLEEARSHVRRCVCAEDKSKDGCYQCLFAYRNAYERDRISRSAALRALDLILDDGGEPETIKSLDEIDFNPALDSHLEYLFLAELKSRAQKSPDSAWQEQLTDGKSEYALTMGSVRWRVECQKELFDDYAVPSKPDFYFTRQDKEGRAIAVFTDGLRFHRDIVHEDTAKRMAIMARGACVWSLTWNDVETSHHNKYVDLFPLDRHLRPSAKLFSRLVEAQGQALGDLAKPNNWGSLDLLMQYLSDPDDSKWQALAYAHAVVNIGPGSRPRPSAAIKGIVPEQFIDTSAVDASDLAGTYRYEGSEGMHSTTAVTLASKEGISGNDPVSVKVVVHLDDSLPAEQSFGPAWNGFLRAMNLYQFLRGSVFFTTVGITSNIYDSVLEEWPWEDEHGNQASAQ